MQNIMRQLYKNYWKEMISTEAKMRSYIQFKTKFSHEPYLDSLQFQQRKSLTCFRISAHNLPIEQGCYCRPKLPEGERTCPFCPPEIGNEIHFLTDCKEYKTQRDATFQTIDTMCKNFINLTNKEKNNIFVKCRG